MDKLFERVEMVRRKFMRIMPRMNADIIMPKEGKETWNMNLTISEMKTLIFFKEQTSFKMSELAEAAGMPLPTATHAVDRMVKGGLFNRVADTGDRRVINIVLTEKGKKTLEDADSFHKESMKRLFEVLEAKDREKLIKAMEDFLFVMEDISTKINDKRKKDGVK